MTEKDQKRIMQLTQKLQSCNLLDVIGASLSVNGINQTLFDKAMKDSEVGFRGAFGCNVSNAVRDKEASPNKGLTILEVHKMIAELSLLILDNKDKE